jgi:ParB-like chromosome segregation protein Spo0J
MKRKNTSDKAAPAAAAPTTESPPTARKVEAWPIAKLKAYAKNARRHSAKQVEQLRKSMVRFGQVWPILVRADGTIIAGHGRLDAAKAAGMIEVNVIVATDWTEEQCRAFGLLDNKLALNSEWDDEMLGVEMSALQAAGLDLDILGFTSKEREKLLPSGNAPEPAVLEPAFQILIECKSEAHQIELLERFQKDGTPCRALIV